MKRHAVIVSIEAEHSDLKIAKFLKVTILSFAKLERS